MPSATQCIRPDDPAFIAAFGMGIVFAVFLARALVRLETRLTKKGLAWLYRSFARAVAEGLAFVVVAHNCPDEAGELTGDGDDDLWPGLARRCAEKALPLLQSHALPASSWTDTEPYRAEIRKGRQRILGQRGLARSLRRLCVARGPSWVA